jgi:hypothetical protein
MEDRRVTTLELQNGGNIEVKFHVLSGVNHSRIVGERLLNCSLEWPLFALQYDEPEEGHVMCTGCDRTLRTLLSVRKAY